MFLDFCVVILGLVFLTLGGHVLVRGASAIALLLRLSPAVVGLTVVAAGTSLPELFVGVAAALTQHTDLLIGNLVGSNFLNIALVIGIAGLIIPINVPKQSIRFEWPIMFGFTLLAFLLLWNHSIERWEGGVLLLGSAAAIVFFVFLGRADSHLISQEETKEILELKKQIEKKPKPILLTKYGFGLVVGIVLLKYGAEFFVKGSSEMAAAWGLSERIIGITLVAIGTSLPELTISVLATLKGRSDVAVGNILGSNIFNLAGILGICALIHPFKVLPITISIDFPWLIGISLLLYIAMVHKRKITRPYAGMLLLVYAIYTTRLFIQ